MINFQVASLATAETKGTSFAAAADCNSGAAAEIAACLRALSVPQILALQGPSTGNGPDVTGLLLDGTVLLATSVPSVPPYTMSSRTEKRLVFPKAEPSARGGA